MELHEAIIQVLRDNQNRWMTYAEIADAVRLQDLFTRPSDQQPPPPGQISARANNKTYRHLFQFDKSSRPYKIRLAAS